ncbi:MAG: hypothetical protein P4M00_04470 [Azospirillaceae bacterium]|nr:hypothetical protein [Azospirillaceae bacterium]
MSKSLSETGTQILRILGLPDRPGNEEVAEQERATKEVGYVPLTLGGYAKKQLMDHWETTPTLGIDPPGTDATQALNLDAARHYLRSMIKLCSPTRDGMETLATALQELAEATARVTQEIEQRDSQRADLQERLDTLVPVGDTPVPGATAAETKQLKDARGELAPRLPVATFVELHDLHLALGQLAVLQGGIVANVQHRLEGKKAVEDQMALIAVPQDADPHCLDPARARVAEALAANPLSDDDLNAAQFALGTLRNRRDEIEEMMAPLRQQRTLLRDQFETFAKSVQPAIKLLAVKKQEAPQQAIDDCQSLFAGALTADNMAAIAVAFRTTRAAIAASAGSNTGNRDFITAVRPYLIAEKQKLEAEYRALGPDSAIALADTKKGAGKQFAAIRAGIDKNSGAGTTDGLKALEDFRATVDHARKEKGEELVELLDRKNAIDGATPLTDPEGVDPWFAEHLAHGREALAHTLAGILARPMIDKATLQLAALTALWHTAERDAKNAALVQAARHRVAERFPGIHGAARPPAQKELDRADTAASACAALTGDKRDMAGALKLYRALEARLDAISKEPVLDQGAPLTDKLFQGVTGDGEIAKQVFNICGPALLGKLDASARKALCTVVSAAGPAIGTLVNEGLGGDPAILDALVTTSGADGLKALAVSFGSDPEARTALAALVEQGGLVTHPQVLPQLLHHDVVGPGDVEARRTANADTLKAMAKGFMDDPGALADLLDGAGLGATSAPPAPPVIVSLLYTGCARDATKLRGFADAFAGDDAESDRTLLKGLVESGGIGQHPESFGMLVEKVTDVSQVKSLGTAFADPADRARLQTLMNNGGLTGKTDTLAKVFVDGFAGDGRKMRQYAQAFDGHAAQSKMMLDAWNEPATDDERQPGAAIARLLGPNKLNGNITALQSRFTAEIGTVANATRRKQAIRFAPYFDRQTTDDSWKPKTPAMTALGIKTVTGSVRRRHTPECFDRTKMGGAVLHSQFPPGVDLGALIDDALTQIRTNGLALAGSHILDVGDPLAPIEIEIGFLDAQTVNHFTPRADRGLPNETPQFQTADIESILRAIR